MSYPSEEGSKKVQEKHFNYWSGHFLEKLVVTKQSVVIVLIYGQVTLKFDNCALDFSTHFTKVSIRTWPEIVRNKFKLALFVQKLATKWYKYHTLVKLSFKKKFYSFAWLSVVPDFLKVTLFLMKLTCTLKD